MAGVLGILWNPHPERKMKNKTKKNYRHSEHSDHSLTLKIKAKNKIMENKATYNNKYFLVMFLYKEF